ncbi:crossover junction endodeoxyribonuclease RuvC [Thermomonospora catenispora]|uniref:crossover junction endodeoxyribonuclease RuvC n=1 Tax=Thermomonospora catenispora TaxID=2493090 RepID=UPI001124C064|nr:crossover junction endodeoxyribonuclease RuvC [Thermomonospora catenispora]TNY35364.1 crossover junction endodeoxyribonuclease RuvC [Thermomonospora catenispora]
MRVLGVDPGLTRCGVGVVDGAPGVPLRLVHVTVLRTSPEEDIAARLLGIETGLEALLEEYAPDVVAVERVFAQHNVRTVMGTALEALLEEYAPDVVAVERVFAQHNVRTVMGTAQAGAIAIVAAARRGLPVALHTPSEAKAAVTGNGRADKAQVTAMVTRLLRLETAPKPADAADALALAICHVWRGGAQARLEAARRAVRQTGSRS